MNLGRSDPSLFSLKKICVITLPVFLLAVNSKNGPGSHLFWIFYNTFWRYLAVFVERGVNYELDRLWLRG
jgi:hypothetical protein